MSWIYLISAGIFEVGMTTSLKFSENFSRMMPTLAFIFFSILSFWLLSLAMKTIPLGTAYAVWTGIGAFGTVLVGIYIFEDPATRWHLFFLTLLVGSIIGLKFVTAQASPAG
ncbi:MAG: multidrug efflux SMR transporter [Candidatus Nitrohelix vancouverensis]|uniref:Guanidinium exporter n=1 Tax=Candidatus Nitrohelix vancouverensis TaxID=2705534 RepID=A0A7T0C154_9BACT|nr:MAG: multidrug efflux SMR transporter [Candidatus Nitrohelix vancouverensis]